MQAVEAQEKNRDATSVMLLAIIKVPSGMAPLGVPTYHRHIEF